MFALVDCNSFYVSCEQAFQPRLAGKPVVVLSNNDGCIVSRSSEAKVIGIRMGMPYFQAKPLLAQHHGQAFSSNYALYGDMSRRVMGHLAEAAPEIEVYSIDEAFLNLTGMQRTESLEAYGRRLRHEVLQYTHIPTCIGIAPTKTLAKLANRVAKRYDACNHVLLLESAEQREWALKQVPVEEVWGIGRRYALKLHEQGITTAASLARVSDAWARKHLGGVVGARIVRELQGQSCLEIIPQDTDGPLARQSVAFTRSFGTPLAAYPPLAGAVAAFTSRAAEKLRRQHSATNMLTVFLGKSRFGPEPPPYTSSVTLNLPVATSDTAELIRYAQTALKKLWRPNSHYQKAGVVFDGLETAGQQQLQLFEDAGQVELRVRLMAELDQLNSRYGAGTIGFAAALAGKEESWAGKKNLRTPAYTTSFEELWRINMDGNSFS
ncbi:Y-family DNA polymerase [Hymenobacter metallicola]|uniref:Y-family DNA polymerase n=1 Tax=Hymenobacter metallicola TaxID=2563114 RepID=A0A4Z0Q990_9BACT|nr:Y-family DNA polymerase [Hymenobacter metallicola]TGE26580.1 Y-family DNA polymerase [Hymenobacter metallicola]